MAQQAGLLAFFFAVAWEEHGDQIIKGAAVVAGLGVIWRVVIVPPMRLFRRMEKAIVTVEQQLMTNNGGSTALDKLDRVVSQVDKIEERTQALEDWRLKQKGES